MKTTGASEGAGGLLEGDKDQALTHGSWTKKKKKRQHLPLKVDLLDLYWRWEGDWTKGGGRSNHSDHTYTAAG